MARPTNDDTDGAASEPKRAWATKPLRYFLVSLYWFPVSLFWGMMLGQILPARVQDFSGPVHKGAYLAVISVVGALASAGIQLVIGPFSDHLGSRFGRRRPFLVLGTTGACIGMLSFGWSHSFVMLTVSYVIIQVCLNAANGPYVAYMPDLTPHEKLGAASAFMGFTQLSGKAGGPLIAGLAIAHALAPYTAKAGGHSAAAAVQSAATHAAATAARVHVFRELLLLDVAIFAVCAIVTTLTLPDWPSKSETSPMKAVRGLFQWDIRGYPSFFRLLLSRGVFNFGFYIALAYIQYYVEDSLKMGLNYATVLTTLQVLTIGGAIVGVIPAGILSDRISKKRIVYVSCAFSAAATAVFALTRSIDVAYVSAVVFGMGFGAFCAVDWAFACNLLPPGSPAKFLAIWSLSDTLPQVLAPTFGPVADVINTHIGAGDGWRAAMTIAAIGVVIAALLMRRVQERPIGRAEEHVDQAPDRRAPAAEAVK